jgi:hypothetical protein
MDLRRAVEDIYDGPSEPSCYSRSSHVERARERWLDSEERDPWRADPSYRTCERRRPPLPIDFVPQDLHHRRSDTQLPHPEIKTKVIHFKEPSREEEDRELEDLVAHMYGLSVCEESYAALYAWCAYRFPNVAQIFPKPIFAQHTSTPVSAPAPVPAPAPSFQPPTPPPPPVRQPWPAAANPPHSASAAAPFRPCVQTEDITRLGIQLGIDTQLVAQPQDAPALTQQDFFKHEAPPHLSHSVDNRVPLASPATSAQSAATMPTASTAPTPSTHIEKAVQVISVRQLKEASDRDLEDAFDFCRQVLAAERKKREIRVSKPAGPRSSLHTSTAVTPPPAAAAPYISAPFAAPTHSAAISAPITSATPSAAAATMPPAASTAAAPSAAPTRSAATPPFPPAPHALPPLPPPLPPTLPLPLLSPSPPIPPSPHQSPTVVPPPPLLSPQVDDIGQPPTPISAPPVSGLAFPIPPLPEPPPRHPVTPQGEVQVSDPPRTRSNRHAATTSDDSEERYTPETQPRADGEDIYKTSCDACCDTDAEEDDMFAPSTPSPCSILNYSDALGKPKSQRPPPWPPPSLVIIAPPRQTPLRVAVRPRQTRTSLRITASFQQPPLGICHHMQVFNGDAWNKNLRHSLRKKARSTPHM